MIPWNDQGYILYQSEYIAKHYRDLIIDLDHAHRMFCEMFPDRDSTWTYDRYNIFTLTSPSSAFYRVYKEVRDLVRGQLGDTRELWIQSWINYHSYGELLTRHHHNFEFHGYISIDPKNTKTVFDDYEIVNKPGQIYFGPGHRFHSVEALEPFEGKRVTLGFDIYTTPQNSLVLDYIEKPLSNNSFIPLL